jgi:peptidylprolyl isomerase
MNFAIKSFAFASSLSAIACLAGAQTAPKPAAPAASGTAVHHTAAASTASKLPPGVPPVRGIVKAAFTLRYEDYKIGTGPDAEPGKLFKVLYTGYLGSNGRPDDGHKFDSSDDHRQPEKDKDGKPVMGPDGKPKMGDVQPMPFPQGMGRLIPGFDQGFGGMKVGGKRRLFIPWQLAYGARGRPGPDAAHPGIPPKSDLIFDVELVDVSDMPTQPMRPGMGGRPMPPGGMARPMPGAPGSAAPGATPGTTPGSTPGTTPGTTPGSATATAPGTTPPPATPPPASTPPPTPPQR